MNEEEQKKKEEEISPEEFEKELQNAKTPEEIMEVIQKLAQVSSLSKEATEKEIRKIRRKRTLLYAIEFVLSFAIMIGVVGLFHPLILLMQYGDLIFIASICLLQAIIVIVLSLFKHPVVILLSDIISAVIVALGVVLFAHFMPLIKFNSEWDELSFIAVFLAAKTIIMTTLKKLIM